MRGVPGILIPVFLPFPAGDPRVMWAAAGSTCKEQGPSPVGPGKSPCPHMALAPVLFIYCVRHCWQRCGCVQDRLQLHKPSTLPRHLSTLLLLQ
jgi:hypothetical protein